jgi:D-alanyl-D-alanine carboxypeptidase
MTNPLPPAAPAPHGHHRLRATLAAATLAAMAAGGCGQETAPAPNTAVERQLQQLLDDSVARPGVRLPGAIAYYHGHAYRPWSGAAGLGEVPARVAMRPGDRFRAGSILKTFLAAVTLQEVESGRLALDQSLPTLLPATVTARIAGADQISLRMLLNHTSGIPEWVSPQVEGRVIGDPGHVWSEDEILDLVAGQPPTFPPGTAWSYSNTNYTLVGMVLERSGGKSWRAQVRERVIDRLGLASTLLPEPGDTTMGSAYAHGYQDVAGAVIDLSAMDPSMAGAAGGHALVTTASDLGRFLDALLAGELFASPGTLAAMETMVDAPHLSGLPHRYGLGLEEYTLPGGTRVIGNSGSTGGYAAMMFRIPARDATLVTAVNTQDLFVNAREVFIPAVDVVASSAP